MQRILAACIVLAAASPLPGQGLLTTYAGTDWIFPANGKPAVDAPLGVVYSLAGDADGNIYLTDTSNRMVFRRKPNGMLEVVAGNGLKGFSGDGGDARNAALVNPTGVALDRAGNLYITDHEDHRIRRVDTRGIITTVAGTGIEEYGGEGVAARESAIGKPTAPAIGPDGSLYFVELSSARIRVMTPDGRLRTVAGSGTSGFSADGTNALRASIAPLNGLAVDGQGRVYFTEMVNRRVRTIDANGALRTLTGDGGNLVPQDGAAATSSITDPYGVVLDREGNVVFAMGPRVMRIVNARLTAVAGSGRQGVEGNGGAAQNASFRDLRSIAYDATGNLFVSDLGCYCVRVVRNGIIDAAAGNGGFGRVADGTPASRAYMVDPRGLAFDGGGNLLVANKGTQQLGVISASGLYTMVAGASLGCCAQGQAAKTAPLDSPVAVAVDPRGRIILAESGSSVVHVIANGIITQLAGSAYKVGNEGDEGPALQATLGRPAGVAVDGAGNIYIADELNRRVRRVTPDGVIHAFAGGGQSGFRRPYALAVTSKGELLVADSDDNRVRIVGTNNVVETLAGNGRRESTGDGGLAKDAGLAEPAGLAVDRQGNVFVLEKVGQRVRRIDAATGVITTVAGTGGGGLSGDGGPSRNGTFTTPELGLAVNARGDLFISDTGNNRIRVILAAAPSLSVDRSSLSMVVRAGERSSQSLEVRSSVSGVQFVVSADGGEWLAVSPRQASAPLAVEVSIDARNLAPGSYEARIQIQAPGAQPASINVPVSVKVEESQSPRLGVSATALTYELMGGAAATSGSGQICSDCRNTVTDRVLSVWNTGGGTLEFTASVSAEGGDWLSVSPTTGTATVDAPGGVQVAVASEGLATGTYSGVITIAAGGEQAKVPVTLAVKQETAPRILLSHAGLSFLAVERGGVPAPQSIGILNQGSGGMNWSSRVLTLSGENWLRLGAVSGRVSRPFVDASVMDVSVDARALAAGEYYGWIEVTAPADNSPQFVTVMLHVLAEGINPGPEVRPAGLIFTGARGTNPGSQTVSVSNLLGRKIAYASGRLTFDGADWFTHSPGNGEVTPDEPGRLVVQPRSEGFSAETRRGVLTMLFEDGSTRQVSILSQVSEAGEGCLSRLEAAMIAPGDDFTAVAGQAATIAVRAVDGCGNALTPDSAPDVSVVARFSNRDPGVRLVHLAEGVWTGTWKPGNVSGGKTVVTAEASVVREGQRSVAQVSRTGSIGSSGRAPVLGELVHAATRQSGAVVAPGELVMLLGENLTEREATEVLMGGRPMTLLSTSSGLEAQVPSDLAANTGYQVMVRRGTALSLPVPVLVAPTQPGVFTKGGNGTGQGEILRADGSTLAESGTAAERGEEVRVRCTGLGAAAEDGRVRALVEVTIGGVQAEVWSARLVPGLPGRYEVRVVVPDRAPVGDAVEVVVTAAGRKGPGVTMAVKQGGTDPLVVATQAQ